MENLVTTPKLVPMPTISKEDMEREKDNRLAWKAAHQYMLRSTAIPWPIWICRATGLGTETMATVRDLRALESVFSRLKAAGRRSMARKLGVPWGLCKMKGAALCKEMVLAYRILAVDPLAAEYVDPDEPNEAAEQDEHGHQPDEDQVLQLQLEEKVARKIVGRIFRRVADSKGLTDTKCTASSKEFLHHKLEELVTGVLEDAIHIAKEMALARSRKQAKEQRRITVHELSLTLSETRPMRASIPEKQAMEFLRDFTRPLNLYQGEGVRDLVTLLRVPPASRHATVAG